MIYGNPRQVRARIVQIFKGEIEASNQEIIK